MLRDWSFTFKWCEGLGWIFFLNVLFFNRFHLIWRNNFKNVILHILFLISAMKKTHQQSYISSKILTPKHISFKRKCKQQRLILEQEYVWIWDNLCKMIIILKYCRENMMPLYIARCIAFFTSRWNTHFPPYYHQHRFIQLLPITVFLQFYLYSTITYKNISQFTKFFESAVKHHNTHSIHKKKQISSIE